MARFSVLSRLLSSGLILAAPLAPSAMAQAPEGGEIRSGAAAIDAGAGQTVIRQTSGRAVIDWRGFDVGAGHAVRFEQPDARAATLNRIEGGRPSRIEGRVTAPGTVILQNGAGVLFTGDARIDVGGLVATSGRVQAESFQRGGTLRIEGGGLPGARVVNEGSVTIGEAGLGALVGRDVENAGAIVARRGTVALASGAETTIDLSGDGMLRVAGAEAGGRVMQSGRIEVGDGRVVMTAGAVSGALDGAINVSGLVRAGSASAEGGAITLTGGGAVRIDGTLDASGGWSGGAVTVSGERIELGATARVAASGGADGGTVRVGGDLGGSGPMPRARDLAVARGAEIVAEGGNGRGGRVVLWSDGDTVFTGRIGAGGASSGGFVETSGRERLAVGDDAEVEVGPGGEWLLDPRDVEIAAGGSGTVGPGTTPRPGADAFVIHGSALAAALDAGGNVTVTTVQPESSAEGSITVADALAWSGPGNLTLRAEADVRIDAAVRTTGAGSFTVDANRDLLVNGSVQATGAGNLALIARVGDISFADAAPTDATLATRSGSLDLEARKGSILMKRDGAAGNVQVYSERGPTRLRAGQEIVLQGGGSAGRWVRLGQEASASAVSLAAPRISVRGGSAGNSFAEVVTGAGGAIAMNATEIAVQNAADQALVQGFGGAPLTLRAERQVWNGPVRAGTGAANGGEVRVAGAIAAGVQPIFDLAPGQSFRLEARTPRGAASAYASDQALVVRTRGAGTVGIDAPVAAERITLESAEAVEFAASGRLAAVGAGDAVVVAAGRRFANRGDADVFALGEGGSRWLVYVDGFDGLDGPVPAEHGFDLYGRTYADQPPASIDYPASRIVYGEQPVLRIAAESLAKTYGEAVAPGVSVSGLRTGDRLETALAAAPTVASDGAPAAAPAGRYVAAVAAQASRQGYRLETEDGLVEVRRAPLTVRAADARRTYGAANPASAAAFDGFVLGEGVADLRGALAFTSDAVASSSPGTYLLRPGGLESGNYAIAFVDGSLAVDRAPLRVIAEDVAAVTGGPRPPFTVRFDGFVLGQDRDDLEGTLAFATEASEGSPAGTYSVTPGGLRSENYAISFEPGRFSLLVPTPSIPPSPAEPTVPPEPPAPGDPPTPAEPTPPTPAEPTPPVPAEPTLPAEPSVPSAPDAPVPLALGNGFAPVRRGVEPLTPGDASFRTTVAEAPPALSAPFVLTYSLGEVAGFAAAASPAEQGAGFVPAAGGTGEDAGGFVPAAAGLAPDAGQGPGCRGAVRMPEQEGCVLVPREESFWTTREEGLQ